MLRGILIGAALLLAYKQATNFYDKLKLSFSNWRFRFNVNDASNTSVDTTLTITNPTNTVVSVNGYQGKALINGKAIGNFRSTNQFTIAANQSVTSEIKATVTNGALIANLVLAIKNRVIPPVTFKGVIRTSIGNLPFTNTVTEGRQL